MTRADRAELVDYRSAALFDEPGAALTRCLDAQTGLLTAEQSLEQARRVIRTIIASGHDRPSLVVRIACDVGGEIVETIIPPGHDLNTVELARRYQTSRTPVREALMLLEREGLVDVPPRRRPRAHPHSIDELREIYMTRTVIFELIAADTARHASVDDIEGLSTIIERMRLAATHGDVTAYTWLTVEFHDIETRLSRNLTAKRIHDSLLLRTLAMRRLSLSQPGRMKKSLEDHTLLVRAYEAHDPILAGAILRANHVAALQAIQQHFDSGGALVAPPAGGRPAAG